MLTTVNIGIILVAITTVGSKDVGPYHHSHDSKCIFIASLIETTLIILCHTYLFYVQSQPCVCLIRPFRHMWLGCCLGFSNNNFLSAGTGALSMDYTESFVTEIVTHIPPKQLGFLLRNEINQTNHSSLNNDI